MIIAMFRIVKDLSVDFRLSMMGVMSRFSSMSSSTKRRSKDANCAVDVLYGCVSVDTPNTVRGRFE